MAAEIVGESTYRARRLVDLPDRLGEALVLVGAGAAQHAGGGGRGAAHLVDRFVEARDQRADRLVDLAERAVEMVRLAFSSGEPVKSSMWDVRPSRCAPMDAK